MHGAGLSVNADRRSAPRLWDADWHVLRALGAALRAALADPELRPAGARVLDFGCGTRPYEAWFAQAGALYQGADIEGPNEVRIDHEGRLDARDAQFDIVASFQVLEHVWDVGQYLREAWRVLRADGRLLLSTHGAWPYHPHPGDFRRWTAEGLRREVSAHGFELVHLWPVVGPLAWTTVFRNLGLSRFLRGIPGAGAPLAAACAIALNCRAWLEDRLTPASITADNACVYLALFRRGEGAC
jgi:SAM-dependent methyltransferase